VIPFYDGRRVLADRRDELLGAVARVIDSGVLILGPEVEAFEAEFAVRVGTREGVGVASGTDALLLALRALDVGPGDEVITVSNAGVPTIAAIRLVGAVPRFVDVDSDRLLLEPTGLEAALNERTRAVIPVHLYGQAVDLDPVLAFARAHDLRVIEDCAQALGARPGGRQVGGRGDAGCFSFYPTKNLGGLGDAGFVATDDAAVAERVRALRMYGFDAARRARIEGLNSRLDEVQAAVLRVRLPHLEAELEERRALAQRYREGLQGTPHRTLSGTGDDAHAHHLMVVLSPDRERSRAALDAAAIGSAVHYPVPVHRMEAYAFLGLAEGTLPATEQACRSVLSLPLHPGLEPADIDRVIDVLNGAFA